MSLAKFPQGLACVFGQLRKLPPPEKHHHRDKDDYQVVATRKNR
jgi:hypothetical protein